MRYPALLILIAGIGFVCASCRTTLKSTSPVQADIAEAVFRYIAQPASKIDEDSHGLNLAHKIYFLQVDGQDPSPELLSRLQNLSAPVKPMSLSVVRDGYRFDAETGERGAAFYIRNIQSIGSSRATVDADFNPGGALRGSGFLYQLAMKQGKWVVVGKKLRWVS